MFPCPFVAHYSFASGPLALGPRRDFCLCCMSGQLHFEPDASMKLFTELITLAASLVRHLGRLVISAAVDSFSSCIECYQRHKEGYSREASIR